MKKIIKSIAIYREKAMRREVLIVKKSLNMHIEKCMVYHQILLLN